MQTARQIISTPMTDNIVNWLEPEPEIAQHIENTITLLTHISQYSQAVYYFYQHGKWYSKIYPAGSNGSDEADVAIIQKLSQDMNLSPISSVFLQLKESLKDKISLDIQSASVLTFKIATLEQEIIIVLLSAQRQQISPQTWQCLEQYIEQRQTSIQGLLENKQLKQKIEYLESVNAGRAKYFSVIAHDLRAPFHGILGCADILAHERDTLDSEAAQRLADYVHDTTQSTYGLLENLLNWSMAEGGRFHARAVHFNVHDMVQSIFDLLSAFAFKKQIKLKCDVASNLYAFADVRMITSVIQNLTSNALKFTASNAQKSVKICAQKHQDGIEISVQDEGLGMTPAQTKHIFKEHALPSTQGTSGEKGTGLGLVLCKRFLEMNHGTIEVESVIGQGTSFKVYIPLGTHLS